MTVAEEESNKVESVIPPTEPSHAVPPPSVTESAASAAPVSVVAPVEEKPLAPLLTTEEKSDDSKAIVLVENPPPVEEKHGSIDRDIVLARVSTEKKSALIKAWEESEKAKAANKAQKKLASIGAWENTQKAEVEAELKKIEEKLEKKKAKYAEKMKNKIAVLHMQAEEKRANIEAKRGEDLLKAEEQAAKYRATGTAPKKGNKVRAFFIKGNRVDHRYESQSIRPATSSPSPMYGNSSLYPRTGLSGHSVNQPSVNQPSIGRMSSANHNSSSVSSGLGIRVALKPEYRITPPPQLSPQFGEIPRSIFQFDFDLEMKILAEAEKENPNWNKLVLENIPSNNTAAPTTSSMGYVTDPVINKYIASGLSREAVPFAVAHYGDNPSKVKEFVNGYKILREMGFSSKDVSEALIMFENDPEKSLAHFLNTSSSS